MNLTFKIFEDNAEAAASLIVAATGFLLTGALVMEHVFAMDPCPLCLMRVLSNGRKAGSGVSSVFAFL